MTTTTTTTTGRNKHGSLRREGMAVMSVYDVTQAAIFAVQAQARIQADLYRMGMTAKQDATHLLVKQEGINAANTIIEHMLTPVTEH